MMSLRRRALIETAQNYDLPDWFQETTYIANANTTSGTIPSLRFNLDYYTSEKTNLYIKAYYLGNSDGFPFYEQESQNGTTVWYRANIYNGNLLCRYGTVNPNHYTSQCKPGTGRISEITVTNGAFEVVSGEASGSYPWNSSFVGQTFQFKTSPMYLFSSASGGSPCRMRLYSNFKLWENGKLAVWLATGYNKNNTSEIGVYDRVRRRFILPTGTGTMYKGSDVT